MNVSTFQVQRQTAVTTKLVITDVDGTMSSFWDYFLPAIRDFMREVSVSHDMPLQELAHDIGTVIDRRGTHEYPWLLEETAFAWKYFEKEPKRFVDELVKPFWDALDTNRAKYLRPYSGVLETLEQLKRQGVKVVALSDAPDYMARVRNMQLFDGLLDAVYCLETVEPKKEEAFGPITLEHGRKRVAELMASTSKLRTKFHVLPFECEKPNPKGLDQVLKDFGVFPQEVVFIGDSRVKDGLVAASRGIRYVWAHYGYTLPAEYEEIANYSLKPQGENKTQAPLPEPLITAVAARYDELLNHI